MVYREPGGSREFAEALIINKKINYLFDYSTLDFDYAPSKVDCNEHSFDGVKKWLEDLAEAVNEFNNKYSNIGIPTEGRMCGPWFSIGLGITSAFSLDFCDENLDGCNQHRFVLDKSDNR